MRKLLNTLYITKEDTYLTKDGSNIVVKQNGEKVFQSPIQNFENIICFTYTGISPALMGLCIEKNVSVSFLTPWGKLQGKVIGPTKGNVLLRREQYRIADSDVRLNYSKLFVLGKIHNSIKVLQRSLRDNENIDNRSEIEQSILKLKESKNNTKNANSLNELLGIEGDSSREYFKVFDNLILQNKEYFRFDGRYRRPPTDPVNAMLSLSYSMLRILLENALETTGLDPYVGFYHTDRPGRTGLALDMMEELRAYMADRFVLTLINRIQIKMDHFVTKENGAVLFTEDGLKNYLNLWNKRNQEEIKHPFLEEKVEVGLLPYVQAMLMARTIRGDLELYPPFFMN